MQTFLLALIGGTVAVATLSKAGMVRTRSYAGVVLLAALLLPSFAFAGSTAKLRFSLTLNVIGPGTVTASPGAKCAGYLTRVHSCKLIYAGGTRVKLTALPKVDVRLSSWRGSLSGTALTRTLAMNAPRVLTATFVKVPAPSPPPPPPPPPALGTRGNPVPLGQTISTVFSTTGEQWTLRIVSTQPDGTAAVLAENQFNDPPASGRQFFLVAVEVHYVSGTKAENPAREAYALNAVGTSNVVYSTYGSASDCGVSPDDIVLKGDLLPGGTMIGNICWSVPSSEAGTLIAFMDYSDGPYYMALR
jgi:hypothetical protein